MKKKILKMISLVMTVIIASMSISSCRSADKNTTKPSQTSKATQPSAAIRNTDNEYNYFDDDIIVDALEYERETGLEAEQPIDAYEIMVEASRISPDEQIQQTIPDGDFLYDVYDKHVVIHQCIADKPTKLIIPDTFQGLPITAIDTDAISNQTVLTEVQIGKNVKVINNGAFGNDKVLSKVIFSDPSSLKYIGANAFQNCKLTDFPSSFSELQYIGACAFNGSHIREFTITSKVLEVCEMAFMTCNDLSKITIENGVKRIDDNAFTFSPIKNVTIPDSVRRLGSYAFAACHELESVVMGDNITVLEEGVFRECKSLTSIKLPEKLNIIQNKALELCESLTEIDIPASVKEIQKASSFKGPFYACKSLKKITLHEGLEKIGDYAFEDIPITDIDIPKSVKEIGKAAFSSCDNLEEIFIPGSILELPEIIVYNCMSLKKIVIGEGMISVNYLFDSCLSLETIELPDSIAYIGFYYMKSSLVIDDIVVKYKGKTYTFEQKDELISMINT